MNIEENEAQKAWYRYYEQRGWERGFMKGYWIAVIICLFGVLLAGIVFK